MATKSPERGGEKDKNTYLELRSEDQETKLKTYSKKLLI